MTKQIIALASATLTMLSLTGCNSNQKHIENTARFYLEAMGNYRIDEATPYSTSFTRENTLPLAKKLTERTDPEYIQSNTPADITIKGSKRLTDTSARVYYHKHTPITEQDDSLTLFLEDGKWLVDVRFKFLPIPLFDSIPPRIKHGNQPMEDSILLRGEYHSIKELRQTRRAIQK